MSQVSSLYTDSTCSNYCHIEIKHNFWRTGFDTRSGFFRYKSWASSSFSSYFDQWRAGRWQFVCWVFARRHILKGRWWFSTRSFMDKTFTWGGRIFLLQMMKQKKVQKVYDSYGKLKRVLAFFLLQYKIRAKTYISTWTSTDHTLLIWGSAHLVTPISILIIFKPCSSIFYT